MTSGSTAAILPATRSDLGVFVAKMQRFGLTISRNPRRQNATVARAQRLKTFFVVTEKFARAASPVVRAIKR
jgi:hypothetical protein